MKNAMMIIILLSLICINDTLKEINAHLACSTTTVKVK